MKKSEALLQALIKKGAYGSLCGAPITNVRGIIEEFNSLKSEFTVKNKELSINTIEDTKSILYRLLADCDTLIANINN